MLTVAIILNYNDADTTLAQLERIRKYTVLDRIIVVDNASTDDSRIRLRHYTKRSPERFILLEADKNSGYGAGNNLGLRYAKEHLEADYALIANPDTEFSESFLRTLITRIKKYPKLAVITGIMQMAGADASDPVNIPGTRENTLHAPAAFPIRPWYLDTVEANPLLRRIFQPILHYPRKYFAGKRMVRVDAVPGSLFLCDLQKILSVGGFDEKIFLYEEEVVLAHKLRSTGFLAAICTDQSFLHHHGVTITKSFRHILQRQKIRQESTLYYFRNYLKISPLQYATAKFLLWTVNVEIILHGGINSMPHSAASPRR